MNTVTTVMTLVGMISAATFAFFDLGRFPLAIRLFIVGASAFVVVIAATVMVWKWARIHPLPGFNRPPSVAKLRLVLGLAAIALVATSSIAVLNVTTSYHSVLYEVKKGATETELRAWGPRSGVATAQIDYPPGKTCLPFGTGQYYQDDPDGPVPSIRVQAFRSPHTAGLRCRPALEPSDLRLTVSEEHIGTITIGEREKLSRRFCFAGVTIWLLIAVGLIVSLYGSFLSL